VIIHSKVYYGITGAKVHDVYNCLLE